MNKVVKMLALSLITGAVLMSSVSLNAEPNTPATEQVVDNQNDAALNLEDGSSDSWLFNRGGWGGLWGGYGLGWGLGGYGVGLGWGGGWGGWGGGCGCGGFGGWGFPAYYGYGLACGLGCGGFGGGWGGWGGYGFY